jgi:DNA-binding NarL/FixJ family response regulator
VSKPINIIIVETSSLILEGLSVVLSKIGIPVHLIRAVNLNDTEKFLISFKKSIVLINPSLLQNNIRLFNSLKGNYPDTIWIGILYAVYDVQLVSLLDGIINIYDSPETILTVVKSMVNTGPNAESARFEEVLSERETEVLKLLATGLANKAIADKLSISINTVMTHRKNISQKTGIKSISGLTIYAVVKKLIRIDSVN